MDFQSYGILASLREAARQSKAPHRVRLRAINEGTLIAMMFGTDKSYEC